MSITITPEQTAWLQAEVAGGRFASLDEAAQYMLDAQRDIEADEAAWIKPLLDEAMADIDRGEGISFEEFEAHIAARLAKLTAK